MDLERYCGVDLWPAREATRWANWLQAHPGVEVISRDRCSAYAEGAAQGSPEAVQVAGRWHLLRNLREALPPIVERQPASLAQAAARAREEQPNAAPGSVKRVLRYPLRGHRHTPNQGAGSGG